MGEDSKVCQEFLAEFASLALKDEGSRQKPVSFRKKSKHGLAHPTLPLLFQSTPVTEVWYLLWTTSACTALWKRSTGAASV